MGYLKGVRPWLIACELIVALVLASYFINHYGSGYEERFLELGLLGRNMKAGDYYPSDSLDVELGANVTWFIYVRNRMGTAQRVSIRIKLLNSTMQAPNDDRHVPSSFPCFKEILLSLDADESFLVPFSWRVSQVSVYNDSLVIERLIVNNSTLLTNVLSVHSDDFRMVFELWVWDQSSGEYKFGWDSGRGLLSVSVYMWFSLVLPTA